MRRLDDRGGAARCAQTFLRQPTRRGAKPHGAAHCSWQVAGNYPWHADLMGVSIDDTAGLERKGMTMLHVTLQVLGVPRR
jgi:hypothetical protein